MPSKNQLCNYRLLPSWPCLINLKLTPVEWTNETIVGDQKSFSWRSRLVGRRWEAGHLPGPWIFLKGSGSKCLTKLDLLFRFKGDLHNFHFGSGFCLYGPAKVLLHGKLDPSQRSSRWLCFLCGHDVSADFVVHIDYFNRLNYTLIKLFPLQFQAF